MVSVLCLVREKRKCLCDCWNGVCVVVSVDWWAVTKEMMMWREPRFYCEKEELNASVQFDVEVCSVFWVIALVEYGESLCMANHLIKGGEIFTAIVCAKVFP